jgi:2-oxoglutarate ferredoxin oxidoreductase subunit gamma
MKEEIIIAGFGGQGVLLAGMVLSQAALESDLHTTWFPSYGAEMRGGTANSTVIISDEEIGSPVVAEASALIALNEQSLDKFSKMLSKNALIIYNSAFSGSQERGEQAVTKIPASEMAEKQIGNIRAANMITLGLYIKKTGVVSLEKAKSACEKAFEGNIKLIELNNKALELGYNFGENTRR